MASDRLFILNQSQLNLPSTCFSCGSGASDRKYMDLGLQVEFFGSIYFCTDCFAAIAENVDFVSSHRLRMLELKYEDSLKHNAYLTDQNEALRYALASLLSPSYPITDDFVQLAQSIVDDVHVSFARIRAAKQAALSDSGTDESSSSEGSPSLSSSSGSDSESGEGNSSDSVPEPAEPIKSRKPRSS